jgi:hypothetical protein
VQAMRSACVAALAVLLACAPAASAQADPVRASLNRMEANASAPPEAIAAWRSAYTRAIATTGRLDGRRKRELRAVLRITRRLAGDGALTTARAPAVFLTLRRNTEWWSRRATPAAGSPGEPDAKGRRCKAPGATARASRVTFPGSRLVWQYYPGSGLQLQVNGTFAALGNLLAPATAEHDAKAAQLLDELLPLGVDRDGFLAWEYLFPFGGGKPPWVSALSQGTAIRALVTAADRFDRPELLAAATRTAGAFRARPSRGVDLRLAKDGSWYLLYSFAPRLRVLNAHLQAVIALHDLHAATRDAAVRRMYAEGLRAARRRIGAFDTGRWSKYAHPGAAADLNYHVLNRNLARGLCQRSREAAICRAWKRYTTYLTRQCPRASATGRGARDPVLR